MFVDSSIFYNVILLLLYHCSSCTSTVPVAENFPLQYKKACTQISTGFNTSIIRYNKRISPHSLLTYTRDHYFLRAPMIALASTWTTCCASMTQKWMIWGSIQRILVCIQSHKGAATYCCSRTTAGPTIASVCNCAGWRIRRVKCYCKFFLFVRHAHRLRAYRSGPPALSLRSQVRPTSLCHNIRTP